MGDQRSLQAVQQAGPLLEAAQSDGRAGARSPSALAAKSGTKVDSKAKVLSLGLLVPPLAYKPPLTNKKARPKGFGIWISAVARADARHGDLAPSVTERIAVS